MASGKKQIRELARQYFKFSVDETGLSAERVAGVLSHVEKHRPAHTIAVLKAYQRLVTAEVARSRAVVEHAGPVGEPTLTGIADAMTKKYRRRVTSVAKR